jgi:glycosyltransferase involved in cell wall biosynthesis
VRISVVVPTGRDPRLARCLAALEAQRFPPDAREVIVVDDARSEEIRRLVLRFPARYLESRGRGAYAARNHGVAAARGEIVAFTDADCAAPPGWLAVIDGVFRGGECDVAVGPSYALNADPVGLLVQAVDEERWARLARARSVTYCDTRNVAAPRCLFETLPFDESFRHGGDLEWAVRAAGRGCRIRYVPEMALGHENVASLRAAWHRGVRRGRGVAGIEARHGADSPITGARPLRVLGRDVKRALLDVATRPGVRPAATASVAVANAALLAALAGLVRVPALRPLARRAFRLFDRASLLQGRLLGPHPW